MKTILLKGELRKGLGTSTAKVLRNEGKVPCALYGNGENINFAVYQADFKNLVYTGNVYKVRIDIDGTTYDTILQDMQFHPVSDAIIHVDFMTVQKDKPVIMDIPVRIQGNSPGVRAGGTLVTKIHKLRVKGLIDNLPDYIDVSISSLEIGQSTKVKEVLVEGFDILNAKENAVVSVKTTRAVIAAADEVAATAPAAEA
jgi:large subunit ribosomal protein L25